MKCDKCNSVSKYGVIYHETGCPNTGHRYDEYSKTWIDVYVCRICGCCCDIGKDCPNIESEIHQEEDGWDYK